MSICEYPWSIAETLRVRTCCYFWMVLSFQASKTLLLKIIMKNNKTPRLYAQIHHPHKNTHQTHQLITHRHCKIGRIRTWLEWQFSIVLAMYTSSNKRWKMLGISIYLDFRLKVKSIKMINYKQATLRILAKHRRTVIMIMHFIYLMRLVKKFWPCVCGTKNVFLISHQKSCITVTLTEGNYLVGNSYIRKRKIDYHSPFID